MGLREVNTVDTQEKTERQEHKARRKQRICLALDILALPVNLILAIIIMVFFRGCGVDIVLITFVLLAEAVLAALVFRRERRLYMLLNQTTAQTDETGKA